MHTIQVKSKKIGTGKKAFTAYKALFGKLWIDVKLTKDANPTFNQGEHSEEFITVNAKNINISVNDNGYPVIWIK